MATLSNSRIQKNERLSTETKNGWKPWSPPRLDGKHDPPDEQPFADDPEHWPFVDFDQQKKSNQNIEETEVEVHIVDANPSEAREEETSQNIRQGEQDESPMQKAEVEHHDQKREYSVKEEEVQLPAYPTAAELEAIHQGAWQSGFEEGKKEGREKGHEEGTQQAHEQIATKSKEDLAFIQSMHQQFVTALAQMEKEVAQGVLQLALECTEKLLATQLLLDPMAILPVIKEALAELPAELNRVRIRLHPVDKEAVAHILEQDQPGTEWQWIEDPQVERGGCMIETQSGRINSTLSSKLKGLKDRLGIPYDQES